MKPNTIPPLSGFRDLLAAQAIARNAMLSTIKRVYEQFGFTPLETPALERFETLTGKYGQEGESLMYKFKDQGDRQLAMRYDLTVPLARVVAQHQNELQFPYKRYHVGNVWRGESPQAGRYREFMQFDADVVGSKSPVVEADIISMMAAAMNALGVNVKIRVNNRLILDALCALCGVNSQEKSRLLIGTIDKLDKIGIDKVLLEIEKEFGENTKKIVSDFLNIAGSPETKFASMQSLFGESELAKKGLTNLAQVYTLLKNTDTKPAEVVFDQTIARGLNYYTGIIYETTLVDLPSLGSVCSGGRYDNLIKTLGGPDLPAVGTSIGVDRLFEGLKQLGKLTGAQTQTQILIANFEQKDEGVYFQIASSLRKQGLAVEIYDKPDTLGKQIGFANALGINYVILVGSEELKRNEATVKNLNTREQQVIPIDDLGKLFLN